MQFDYKFFESWSFGDWVALGSVSINTVFIVRFVFYKLRDYAQKRRLRTVLPHKNVLIHIPSRDLGRDQPMTASEDYKCALHFANTLGAYGYETEIDNIDTQGNIETEEGKSHLVICGPKNSYLVSRYFEGDLRFSFFNDEGVWRIRDNKKNIMHFSPKDKEKPEPEDIAFVGRVSLPSHEEPLMLVCGLHAIGSLGVAEHLSNRSNFDKILKDAPKTGDFGVITKSRFSSKTYKIISTRIVIGPVSMKRF